MITDHSIVIRKIILSMWLNTLRLCMRDSKASIQRVASSRAFKKAQLFNPVTWSFQTATWYSLTLFGISAACDPLSLKRPWAPMRLNVCFAFKELCLPSESAGKPQLASIFSSVEAFYALPRLCGPQAKRGCASLSHCLKDNGRANAHICKSGPATELFCFSHLVFAEKEKRFGITKTDTRFRRKGGSTNSAVW